ncbi:hypothetical protein [Streptomyces formicae]|nr:hypothetical protein [Streptomyces formicae]
MSRTRPLRAPRVERAAGAVLGPAQVVEVLDAASTAGAVRRN